MHALVAKLIRGERLTRDEAHAVFENVIRGELSPVEITAGLVALKLRGESPEEIAGAAAALLHAARPFPRPEGTLADVVGTGGDGAGTINISTAVALVAAAAGVPVAKHGNRAVSSRCGAADLLERLGFPLELSSAAARRCLDETGFTFLFAPHYHAGIRHVMPVRKELGVRTIFNILGPLVNPARPRITLVGAYAPALCRPMAEALRLLGCERGLVVHGAGLDEIAIHGDTQAIEVNRGGLIERQLSVRDFGAREHPLADLIGGDAEQNAAALTAVLTGQGHPAHAAAVAVNAAALLWLAGRSSSLAEGYDIAANILSSGAAWIRLQQAIARAHA
jgi:anthranilate phosphoribosyltransferase